MAEGINDKHGFDYFQFDGLGGRSKCGTLSMKNFNVKSFSLLFGLIYYDLKL